jgi:hypothetical protein
MFTNLVLDQEIIPFHLLVLDDVLLMLRSSKSLCRHIYRLSQGLQHLRIQRLTEIKWFENYLSDRIQLVKVGVKFSFLDITKGVPHGSELGPVILTI